MEKDVTFFFDSYALIEIFEKKPNYEEYSKANAITTYFQVYEVYHNLMKSNYDKDKINDYFIFLQTLCIELDFDWIPKCAEFKREYKKRDLSYTDCLGYIIAKDLKIKFLTGDKEFQDLPNVEFVK